MALCYKLVQHVFDVSAGIERIHSCAHVCVRMELVWQRNQLPLGLALRHALRRNKLADGILSTMVENRVEYRYSPRAHVTNQLF